MAQVLPEEQVVVDWLRRIEAGDGFLTVRDGPVTVLDPGRRNDDHSADFTDALLATRRGLVIGDIEVHTCSSGWWSHGHDADPAYNQVVLHVVNCDDAGRDAVLANGRTVPTVVLEGPGTPKGPFLPDTSRCLPCATGLRPPEEVSAVLDDLGLARFEELVRGFREAFGRDGPDQALYAGLAAALGYRCNRDPMRRLAALLPFADAWYDRNGYAAGKSAAIAAWRDHPPLADNVVFEEVRQRLGLPRPATALRQQGMLQLQKKCCTAGNCKMCPVVA